MAAPTVGPCEPWTTPAEIVACNCSGLDPADPATAALLEAAVAHASQTLFGLSGRQYPGECVEDFYPCLGDNGGCGGAGWGSGRWSNYWWSTYPTIPTRIGGQWHNIGACGGKCKAECVKLPGPIRDIQAVIIDGVTLDPSAYRVRGYRRLCRIDGGKWPCTQDFTVGGTWHVQYTRGKPIEPNMRFYASMLGCEFAKAACNSGSCLPDNVVSVVRDGVSIDFERAEELFNQQAIGMELIDQWLKTVNPGRIARRATVGRADDPRIMGRWTT